MGALDGKAVLITGAGRGLGRAYALHAAESGAAVVVNDVDGAAAAEVAAAIRYAGGRAAVSAGSVTEPDRARAAVARCVAEFGGIDGLVNNAGLRYQAMVWEDDPTRQRELIEVNVLGSLYCGSAAAKAMRARGAGGAIVNAGSLAMLGQSTASTYSASKGAIASMTFAWALELAPDRIRVNCICPVAWTRMAVADTKASATPEETPDRIAPLVTYLLSDRARGVTGQLIRFTGQVLHIVSQPVAKPPLLRRKPWRVEEVAEAFAGELAGALELPPGPRWR